MNSCPSLVPPQQNPLSFVHSRSREGSYSGSCSGPEGRGDPSCSGQGGGQGASAQRRYAYDRTGIRRHGRLDGASVLIRTRSFISEPCNFIQSIDVEVARDLDDKELRSIDQNKGMCWLLSAGCHAAGSQPAAKPQSIARDKASSIFPANVSFS